MPPSGNNVTGCWIELAGSSRCLRHMGIRMILAKPTCFDKITSGQTNGLPALYTRDKEEIHINDASRKQRRTRKKKGTKTHNPRRSIPKHNRDRQRHNIPHPPRKIQQQEKIPHEPTRQTRPIQTQAPFRIWEPNRLIIHIRKL